MFLAFIMGLPGKIFTSNLLSGHLAGSSPARISVSLQRAGHWLTIIVGRWGLQARFHDFFPGVRDGC
jgi:hypothetical protein